MGTLEWLDTHLVHHRYEWSRLNLARPLLKRLICDRFERSLGEPDPEETERILREAAEGRERARARLAELRVAAAERTRTMSTAPDTYDWADDPDLPADELFARFRALPEADDEFAELDTTEAQFDAMAAGGVDADDDFYENDEPLADVLAAWERSKDTRHLTAPPK